ncbi:hypothetical protein LTR27_001560 [Elasticomyces elasticus]|nr:hypothetical protein LTR27_001560 [Elasticomyces elasticus]
MLEATARALKHGFEMIDRNNNCPKGRHPKTLAKVIKDYTLLQDLDQGPALVGHALTERRFVQILQQAVYNHPRTRPAQGKQSVKELWTKGALLVRDAYLSLVKYKPYKPKIRIRKAKESKAEGKVPLRAAGEHRVQTPESTLTSSQALDEDPLASPSVQSLVDANGADGKPPHKRQKTKEQHAILESSDSTMMLQNEESKVRAKDSDYTQVVPEEVSVHTIPDGCATPVEQAACAPGGSPTPDQCSTVGMSQVVTSIGAPVERAKVSVWADNLDCNEIEDSDIRDGLYSIWLLIDGTARSALGILSKAEGSWPSDPEGELRRSCEILFTKRFKARVLEMNIEELENREAIGVCMAATLFNIVQSQGAKPPCEGPEEQFACIRNSAMLDRILELHGCCVSLKRAMWVAARAEVETATSETFGKDVSVLAQPILAVLKSQLESISVRYHDDKLERTVTKTVFKALMLKIKMRTAPCDYKSRWVCSGEIFDPSIMEEDCEVQGKREVLWGLIPLVQVETTKGGRLRVVARARVVAREWPAGRE